MEELVLVLNIEKKPIILFYLLTRPSWLLSDKKAHMHANYLKKFPLSSNSFVKHSKYNDQHKTCLKYRQSYWLKITSWTCKANNKKFKIQLKRIKYYDVCQITNSDLALVLYIRQVTISQMIYQRSKFI